MLLVLPTVSCQLSAVSLEPEVNYIIVRQFKLSLWVFRETMEVRQVPGPNMSV